MRYFWFALFICLTGCTTISQLPTEIPSPSNNTSRTNALQSWNMQGAIAVKTPQKGWNASFNWSQNYTNYDLNIFGPLGSHRVSLMGNNQYAVLTTAEKTCEAANAEALLVQQLGWYIPVNSIYYWVRGLPAPAGAVNHIVRNARGQIIRIEQQGWQIDYLVYDTINGLNLPTLIELRNSNVFIRIAIHQWNF